MNDSAWTGEKLWHHERQANAFFDTIMTGVEAMQYPLSVQEDAYAENMTPAQCAIASLLLEQAGLRMVALARYLRFRNYPRMNHEKAVGYRDNVMQVVRLQLEVS